MRFNQLLATAFALAVVATPVSVFAAEGMNHPKMEGKMEQTQGKMMTGDHQKMGEKMEYRQGKMMTGDHQKMGEKMDHTGAVHK
jgi:hypothetical protein